MELKAAEELLRIRPVAARSCLARSITTSSLATAPLGRWLAGARSISAAARVAATCARPATGTRGNSMQSAAIGYSGMRGRNAQLATISAPLGRR